ncbi:cytochrome P450 [Hysterangium stoloniferum]|nr:cytochrome P450 [Hysterangium stoloniferum]
MVYSLPFIAFIVGVLCHGIFSRIEPRRVFVILGLLTLPPCLIPLCLYPWYDIPLKAFITSIVIYLGSLSLSTVVYRLSPFHPLAHIPGPLICRITRLWAVYIAYTGNQQIYYKYLHDKYGTHVRAGPNHVFIRDAQALNIVMSIKPFWRGERYDIMKIPGTTGSLIELMDPQEHAERKRIWEKSMNTSAVQGYSDALAARIIQLTDALEKRQGAVVDLGSWLSCFSFDFMGDLAFGGAFHLLQRGYDVDGYTELTRMSTRFRELIGGIPWAGPFYQLLPASGPLRRLRKFATDSIQSRIENGSMRKDIFYYLLDEDGIGSGSQSYPTLRAESSLVMVAGSDTTGTALSNVFFYLLANRTVYSRLQKEVDEKFPRGADVFTSAGTADMKYLNAVINESLRLQPAVPNGIHRLLPRGSGGCMIAEKWIPGGTTVQIASYSVHRDPRYFSPDPEQYNPDRWIDKGSGLELDQTAYFPFSYGPTSCVGKNLALFELRTVICSLIQRFEVEFAPKYDLLQWERDLKDNFILVKGPLPVRIRSRW